MNLKNRPRPTTWRRSRRAALTTTGLVGCTIGYTMVSADEPVLANAASIEALVADSVVGQSSPTGAEDMRPIMAIEPRAEAIFRAMSDYLASAPEFTFHAEVEYDDVVLDGVKIEYSASLDMAVRRPGSMYAEMIGDRSSRRFWYDGNEMALFAAGDHVYAKTAVPSTIDAALDHIMENHDFSLPLAEFAYSDPFQAMTENVRLGFYVGLHNVHGARCHHLVFLQDDIHWQIWIEDGPQLVPHKLVITYVDMPDAPRYAAILSDWDFNPRLPDHLFIADPPADATLIDFITMNEAVRPSN